MEDGQMQLLRFQANIPLRNASQRGKSSESFRKRVRRTFRRALARFAAIFDHRAHAEAAIASRYRGQCWTDSTERRLNNDLEKLGI
jgi:hypothetical protein